MEGAWQKLLHPLSLTSSGRPQLLEGEVECHLLSNTDLEPDPSVFPAGPLRGGLVILTSYRILWINEDERNGGAIPLAAVSRVTPPKRTIKAMFSSPRVKLELWITSKGALLLHGLQSAVSSITLSLAIRGQSRGDSFVVKLNKVLHSKAWEAAHLESEQKVPIISTASPSSTVPSKLMASMAGVTGILRKEQEQWEETDKNLQDAFVDLNALMSKAKEMVILAERMRAKLLSAPGNGQGDEELGSKQEMQDWLLSVGIASPVTKESAGTLYHQQLSRQLADFVRAPLEKAGGMMGLVDVYCLFNRARGTELISPDDLLQACSIWESIDVLVMLRRFDSGVMVIQSKSHSDEEFFSRINSLLSSPDVTKIGLSASDAARALSIPPALAKEQLLTAENKGCLCRDDAPDGLRFFLNFFKEVA